MRLFSRLCTICGKIFVFFVSWFFFDFPFGKSRFHICDADTHIRAAIFYATFRLTFRTHKHKNCRFLVLVPSPGRAKMNECCLRVHVCIAFCVFLFLIRYRADGIKLRSKKPTQRKGTKTRRSQQNLQNSCFGTWKRRRQRWRQRRRQRNWQKQSKTKRKFVECFTPLSECDWRHNNRKKLWCGTISHLLSKSKMNKK